jgi:hypothetical protein
LLGLKAEDELLGMTRGEVETELKKIPGHKEDFKRFNTHLVKRETTPPPKTTAKTKQQAPAKKAAKGK